ncbi:hypothetical protein ACF1BE_27085 [Streptomyces sp. NPDC014991]|uniref:hypothetical protein n=1 Tax=Streptomyces sp. NPDC014991 TaxID=3364935 RepID=UPI0036FD4D57
MTATGGLPYEECARWGERSPRDAVSPWPAYALPPFGPDARDTRAVPAFRPAPRPVPRSRRRVRRRLVDGAVVSGVLTALCAAALLVTVVLATVRTRG